MASILSVRHVRPPFFSLPPHLRTNSYTTARHFSASSPKRVDLVDLAVAGPSAVLDGIHGLGIPWHTALPLAAVLVRTTFVYYIAARRARRNREIQNQLIPLAAAHAMLALKSKAEIDRREEMKLKYTSRDDRRRELKFTRSRAYWKAMNKLGSDYGVKRFRPSGLLNFGMLIAFTEAIRLKCGTREGLLPTLLMPFEWIKRRVEGEESPPPPAPDTRDPAEILAERLEAAREQKLAIAQDQGQDSVTGEMIAIDPDDYLKTLQQQDTATQLTPATTLDTASPYFDPSMQIEGPSWITNLTLPDPTWALPIMLFNTMFFSTLLRPTPAGPSSPQNQGIQGLLSRTNFLQRLGLAISYLFFFAALKMPAAVLLYFVPSLAAGWIQQRWLDWKYPIQPAIQPCARPVRVKTRKGW